MEKTEVLSIIQKWLKPSHIRLQAGEMSAQEMRTVLAVVGAIEREIAALDHVHQ